MAGLPLLLTVLALGAPPVEATTLDGRRVVGELEKLGAETFVAKTTEGPAELPVADLLEVRFTAPGEAPAPPENAVHVGMVDGTRLRGASIAVAGGQATVALPGLDALRVPVASVANFRLGAGGGPLEAAWSALTERELKRDLLVVQKGDVLDHLEGQVGTIDDKTIRFLLDGDEIPVNRARVYGVVYARRPPEGMQTACRVELAGGDVLSAKSVAWSDKGLETVLASGGTLTVPAAGLKSLDFSAGKVRWLSQMEPRQLDYTFFFDDEADRWVKQMRKDRNQDGGPIRLGRKEYRRGLWLHSRTLVRYRLGTEYRRFQAVMGIEESDENVARHGDVKVTIAVIMPGDERKVLLEADVKGTDKQPRVLDLDVSGARDLEILVDFGGNDDVADHLALGDAKVLK